MPQRNFVKQLGAGVVIRSDGMSENAFYAAACRYVKVKRRPVFYDFFILFALENSDGNAYNA